MRFRRIEVDTAKCAGCGFCAYVNVCRSPGACCGCLSCFWACPYSARYVTEEEREVELVEVFVDGVRAEVPSGITVARALEYLGYSFGEPSSKKPSLACRTGGCWSCAVAIDGSLERSCVTPVRRGMRVETDVEGLAPKRIVHGPEPHTVGGKATPWWEVNYFNYVEAAVWVAGCNLRCPQCQNYHVTYDNRSEPLEPAEAARLAVGCHRSHGTRGVAVSGGEPAINRRWLVEFFREVSKRVKPGVRRYLDSNGTVLTYDYIDELVEAGCNNMGIEPKCARVETYMRITGISDESLASRYLETSWRAVGYVYERYSGRVYLGVGIVYNAELVSLDEICEAGERVASIDPRIQVTVLDYFPTFRRREIGRPSVAEMLAVKRALEDRGLKTVIVQTRYGHVGPGDRDMRSLKR